MTTETEQTEQPEKLSLSDTVGSLSGFEEIAIEERFGATIGAILNVSLSKAGRALLFIKHRREGLKDSEAYKRAMELRLVDVSNLFFTDDEDADDVDPDNPYSDQGKDARPSD